MLLPWLVAEAPADTGAFLHVRDSGDCSISMRPESDPAGAAMRAECRWGDVDATRMAALVTDYASYPSFLFPVVASDVVSAAPDGRTLVFQRQQLFGIADREVLLWMETLPEDGGAVRVSWTTAADQPLTLTDGAVRTPKNEGYWEVVPDPDGGARVVHEIALDPGGSVPRWLVAMVRTRGFARLMDEVHTAARTP